MKILVLSPKPPWPPHDGGAVAIMRCVEGLATNGAQVSLLAMKTEKHGNREIQAGGTAASNRTCEYKDKPFQNGRQPALLG